MVLNNVLFFKGTYDVILILKDEFEKLTKNPKQSKLYDDKTTKYISKIKIEDIYEKDYYYNLKINFKYKKSNIDNFLNLFRNYNVETIHMCEDERKEIWIVNKYEYIKQYRLIPYFAIKEVLLDYMKYRESAIILDSYETIKYDRNSNKIVVNNKKLTHNELLELLFTQTIRGKQFYDILEQFIDNYYQKCINSYEELYAINKEKIDNEEPSPFALFFVTFGVLGIIFILIKVMGYL